jgi:hypothetical protein
LAIDASASSKSFGLNELRSMNASGSVADQIRPERFERTCGSRRVSMDIV